MNCRAFVLFGGAAMCLFGIIFACCHAAMADHLKKAIATKPQTISKLVGADLKAVHVPNSMNAYAAKDGKAPVVFKGNREEWETKAKKEWGEQEYKNIFFKVKGHLTATLDKFAKDMEKQLQFVDTSIMIPFVVAFGLMIFFFNLFALLGGACKSKGCLGFYVCLVGLLNIVLFVLAVLLMMGVRELASAAGQDITKDLSPGGTMQDPAGREILAKAFGVESADGKTPTFEAVKDGFFEIIDGPLRTLGIMFIVLATIQTAIVIGSCLACSTSDDGSSSSSDSSSDEEKGLLG